jgi:(1->4)-alpha-D-glucan 1-alpha-D-glucosylmutase
VEKVKPVIATYRIQLNRDFPIEKARGIIGYLHDLGVSHLYCSPVLASRPGSTHGYDVIDPSRLDPELGTEEDWRQLAQDVHSRGMSLVLDIVPNHMATGQDNPYWDDVLRNGQESPYASWFDIDWTSSEGRVVVPVLGDEPEAVIESGELVEREENGERRVRYHDMSFPVRDGSPTDIRSLLMAQRYRLVHWRRSTTELNYRRFFDVNELVSLRQEDPAVFEQTHAKVLEWVEQGVVDGLRIDHVDGLRDPEGYLRQLRNRVGDAVPVWVEKILLGEEQLRTSWPVQGTTGYESIGEIENALLDAAGAAQVEAGYRKLRSAASNLTFERMVIDAKEEVLRNALRPDHARVTRLLENAARAVTPDVLLPRRALAGALSAFVACLQVYRSYVRPDASSVPADREVLERAIARVREFGLARERELTTIERVIEAALRARVRDPDAGEESRSAALVFMLALQQLTGPAAAKGVEDTALYRWVPLASRNEVGGEPDAPLENALQRMHEASARRLEQWPLSMRAASTHDTKRSADVRARISVLSEMPDEWNRLTRRWRERNRPLRRPVEGLHHRSTPDSSAEYLVYQTLLALWPIGGESTRTPKVMRGIATRAREYMLKAAREAKERTSWTATDHAFETGLQSFIDALVTGESHARFRREMDDVVRQIAPHAAWTALAREVLRFMSPGAPDIYQGDEIWNFSLVDPDNRRPVDFAKRSKLLEDVKRVFPAGASPTDDALKLRVVEELLAVRRTHWTAMVEGGYEPLYARGEVAGHVVGFVRHAATTGQSVIVLTCVRTMTLFREFSGSAGDIWGDSWVPLPPGFGGDRLRCALTGNFVSLHRSGAEAGGEHLLRLRDVFEVLPLSVLTVASEQG